MNGGEERVVLALVPSVAAIGNSSSLRVHPVSRSRGVARAVVNSPRTVCNRRWSSPVGRLAGRDLKPAAAGRLGEGRRRPSSASARGNNCYSIRNRSHARRARWPPAASKIWSWFRLHSGNIARQGERRDTRRTRAEFLRSRRARVRHTTVPARR